MSESLKPELRRGAHESSAEDQIAFVLSHPGMSAWLKRTLSDALSCDPIDMLNDLEILNLILRKRSRQLIEEEFGLRQH